MHGILILTNLQESPQGTLKMQTSETHLDSLNHNPLEYDLEPCFYFYLRNVLVFFFFLTPKYLLGYLRLPSMIPK